MGSSGGGGEYTPVRSSQTVTKAAASAAPIAPTVQTPQTETITPALAHDIGADTKMAQQAQAQQMMAQAAAARDVGSIPLDEGHAGSRLAGMMGV